MVQRIRADMTHECSTAKRARLAPVRGSGLTFRPRSRSPGTGPARHRRGVFHELTLERVRLENVWHRTGVAVDNRDGDAGTGAGASTGGVWRIGALGDRGPCGRHAGDQPGWRRSDRVVSCRGGDHHAWRPAVPEGVVVVLRRRRGVAPRDNRGTGAGYGDDRRARRTVAIEPRP